MTEQALELRRREFLKWLCKIGGGVTVLTLGPGMLPLRRVNMTLFRGTAHAQQPCTDDVCTTRDSCETGDAGHTCQVQDVCDVDESGDCTGDRCITDTSGPCTNDGGPTCPEDGGCSYDTCSEDYAGLCEDDSSGPCTNDGCYSDSSGTCGNDRCTSDSSGDCTASDTCISDESGACTQSDKCLPDSSGTCATDQCTADSSGTCGNDSCTNDVSLDCTASDTCTADSSGACATDQCTADSSGACATDQCTADSSGTCATDQCTSDISGDCTASDTCIADSSQACTQRDICIADSSQNCSQSDSCRADYSGECTNRDSCNSDGSGSCNLDVCVLDLSYPCTSDLCREDRSPSECTAMDTCALDISFNSKMDRRNFARAAINQAIKALYRMVAVVMFLAVGYGQARADTVIDATDAVFSHAPYYVTAESVSVPSPVGPFLGMVGGRFRADVNGNGLAADDPEVRDYNSDGTRELPPGTAFTGNFQFTCFHIPDDVAIVSTGPLTIAASLEVAVFGAVRLASGIQLSSPAMIDLRTSAWLSEDGSDIRFTTALAGDIDETQNVYDGEEGVPPIDFISICSDSPAAIPTINQWGMIILTLLLCIAGFRIVRRKTNQ